MNEEAIFNIKLTLTQANIILEALQELPAKICNPLATTIKAQAEQQLQEMNVNSQVEE
jgi:hypothetical protein